MGPEGAVNIVFRGELAKIEDEAERSAARARFTDEYRERFANPYKAASLGYIDEIIRPRDTRPHLIRALRTLKNKRQDNPQRKHGNIPL
jgi:propionyl-CoA carboxylase beta chain